MQTELGERDDEYPDRKEEEKLASESRVTLKQHLGVSTLGILIRFLNLRILLMLDNFRSLKSSSKRCLD